MQNLERTKKTQKKMKRSQQIREPRRTWWEPSRYIEKIKSTREKSKRTK